MYRFMVLAGAGIGLTGGPLAFQAHFWQGDHHITAVTGLTLFVYVSFALSLTLCLLCIYSSDP
jgi:hypothetical protein